MMPNQTRIAVQPTAMTFERVRYCNAGGVLISEGLLRSVAGFFIELAPSGVRAPTNLLHYMAIVTGLPGAE
jgi:hypothetical protein